MLPAPLGNVKATVEGCPALVCAWENRTATGKCRGAHSCCSIPWVLRRAESAISPSWQPRLQGFGQLKRLLSAGCREGCPGKRFIPTSLSICLSTSTVNLSSACSSHHHPSRSTSTQPAPGSGLSSVGAHCPSHATASHLTASCPAAHLHTQAALNTPNPLLTTCCTIDQHPCLCVPRGTPALAGLPITGAAL